MNKLIYLTAMSATLAIHLTASAQSTLDPATQPQFVNPLPVPGVIDARSGGTYNITISQFEQDLGLVNPETKQPLLTKVWGYNQSYPGPTILAKKNTPIEVRWINNLVLNNSNLPHLLPVDETVHWALMDHPNWQNLGVPIVTHLHGGHTESASDGLPDAWYTPGNVVKGKGYVKETFHYSNDQEAATIWYHDHALGITRLNVYAGLAGFYLLTDENEMALQNANALPAAPYDLGLAIQDRIFTTEGQLFYQTMPESMNDPENSIMPEFFGNIILVNGKAWPVLDVEPRAYRFRLLNGSDSRFYNLFLSSTQNFVQIGSDDGLLPSNVTLSKLLIAPGERKDVIIDFSDPKLWGQTIVLHNNAKSPYPKGMMPDPKTTGRIMAFRVTKPFNSAYPATTLPASLRPPLTPLNTTLKPRILILHETTDDFNRIQPMLGTFEEGVKAFDDNITETVRQGSTEIWEIYNFTTDAHPIHLHMVHMQLINRQKFKASIDLQSGTPVNLHLNGQPILPGADEAGWKDTYISYPGEVLRVIATFDLQGLYVWHCHILSHEDHEMMRPYFVEPSGPIQAQASAVKNPAEEEPYHIRSLPNPFNKTLILQFQLKQPSAVQVDVYDGSGALVQRIMNGRKEAGLHQVNINGSNWKSGTYFAVVMINGNRLVRKLVLVK